MLFPYHAPIFNHRKFAFIAWYFAYLFFFFFLISRSFHELELVVMHFAFDSSSLSSLSPYLIFQSSDRLFYKNSGNCLLKRAYEVISWVKLIRLTFFPPLRIFDIKIRLEHSWEILVFDVNYALRTFVF